MPTDLRSIPGAGDGRRGRRQPSGRRGAGPVPRYAPPLLSDPRAPRLGGLGGREGRRRRGPKAWTPRTQRSVPWSSIAIALGFVALGVFIWSKFWEATRVQVEIVGISDGAQLTLEEASGLDVRIDVAQLDLEAGITPTLFFNGFPADNGPLMVPVG